MYHNPSVDDGYHVPAPAAFTDFQPPYFPPPNTVPQPPTGASSSVQVEFTPGAINQQPRLFSANNMYGYTPGIQSAMAPAHYNLITPSSIFDPTDCGIRATAVGGGEVYGVRSPQRATGGGGEVRVNCGTASTAAAFQATSALPDFVNLDNFTFTPACINIVSLCHHVRRQDFCCVGASWGRAKGIGAKQGMSSLGHLAIHGDI